MINGVDVYFSARGRILAQMWQFNCYQNGGCLPSWICCTPVWTTYEEYLFVFVTVQNLV